MKPETLHDAAKLGDREAAEALIAEGAEVNRKDARGITPLGVAVKHLDNAARSQGQGQGQGTFVLPKVASMSCHPGR